MPLVVRARMRRAKTIPFDEDEDEDVGTSVGEHEQQQQQAGPSKDVQTNEIAWQRWSSSHRAIYSPFVYAPDLVAPAHPFGIYAPGTMPELGHRHPAPSYSDHVTYQYDDDDEEEEEDLMPIETDEEALEVELRAEALLDAADARAAAAYEAGIWRELRSGRANVSLRRSRKRRRSGDSEEAEVRLRTRKRRKNVLAGGSGGYDEGADLEMYENCAGGANVSAAVIDDSDLDSE